MAKDFELKFHKAAWNTMVKDIVDTECVAGVKRVADASNAQMPGSDDGYMVSTEGDQPLSKHGYRATAITATAHAMRDNAKHNRLVQNFHLAGGI